MEGRKISLKKIFIAGLVFCLLCFFLLQLHNYFDLTKKCWRAQSELLQLRRTAALYECTTQELEKNKKKLDIWQEPFKAKLDLGEMLAFLGALTEKANLTIDSVAPGKLSAKSSLQELPVSLSVTGSYKNILVFCSALEKSSKPFLLTGLKVIVENPPENDPDNTSQKLRATLNLLCVYHAK